MVTDERLVELIRNAKNDRDRFQRDTLNWKWRNEEVIAFTELQSLRSPIPDPVVSDEMVERVRHQLLRQASINMSKWKVNEILTAALSVKPQSDGDHHEQ